jgi:dynein heavy chain
LDKSVTYTVITKITDPAEVKKRPTFGCFIDGLYLEGARWDIEKGCLDRQRPKELIYKMPCIRIIPIEVNRIKLRDSLSTPIYKTMARRNAIGERHVFNADLHTEEHPSHWILQGLCLVLRIR